MKIITNHSLINRNKKIGQFSTIISILVLGAGLYTSFQNEFQNLTFIALIVGFLLSQVGIYYITRWGRSPRPDEQINLALKGLDDKYSIYHYQTPASHLLVGPSGLIAITPAHQGGTITFDEKSGRWKQKGGNLYMKIFAQESLGRPDVEIKSTQEKLIKYLKNHFENLEIPEPQSILFFMSEKATVQANNAPIPTLQQEKLKDCIRRKAKENPVQPVVFEKIREGLPQAD